MDSNHTPEADQPLVPSILPTVKINLNPTKPVNERTNIRYPQIVAGCAMIPLENLNPFSEVYVITKDTITKHISGTKSCLEEGVFKSKFIKMTDLVKIHVGELQPPFQPIKHPSYNLNPASNTPTASTDPLIPANAPKLNIIKPVPLKQSPTILRNDTSSPPPPPKRNDARFVNLIKDSIDLKVTSAYNNYHYKSKVPYVPPYKRIFKTEKIKDRSKHEEQV